MLARINTNNAAGTFLETVTAGRAPHGVTTRAATLLELALPGSAYLYQGEELGLTEVADIPATERQDPSFFRNPGVDIGRDGCRVPLPWNNNGTSFAFGTGASHHPQPAWFGGSSVEAQDGVEGSTLELYRNALAIRARLQTAEELQWNETGEADVLSFTRPNGWSCVTNFGTDPVDFGAGQVLLSSSPLVDGKLPGAATVWLQN